MTSKFKIDRHFLFLHNEKLAIFAERALRGTGDNSNLAKPTGIWNDLQRHYQEFRQVLDDVHQKQHQKMTKIRELETYLLLDLSRLADYIEENISCRSDVFTTGFRSQTEQRKETQTRRRQRIASKMGKIEENSSGKG